MLTAEQSTTYFHIINWALGILTVALTIFGIVAVWTMFKDALRIERKKRIRK